MSPEQRLEYHTANSRPLMDGLHAWLNAQLVEHTVEPKSSLGDAIKYMLKRWHKLTGFSRIPGAPPDNNICERALKKTICHRKNSLFFKTERGAAAGDMFHSLIHTCELSGVNPHDYLTALLNHSASVRTRSREWMPWNYQDTISRLPARRLASAAPCEGFQFGELRHRDCAEPCDQVPRRCRLRRPRWRCVPSWGYTGLPEGHGPAQYKRQGCYPPCLL